MPQLTRLHFPVTISRLNNLVWCKQTIKLFKHSFWATFSGNFRNLSFVFFLICVRFITEERIRNMAVNLQKTENKFCWFWLLIVLSHIPWEFSATIKEKIHPCHGELYYHDIIMHSLIYRWGCNFITGEKGSSI